MDVDPETGLKEVDWRDVIKRLGGPGWARLPGVVSADTCARLVDAAPSSWLPIVEEEGGTGSGVRQAGLSCHAEIARSAPVVRSFAHSICSALNLTRSAEVAVLPPFNHAQWTRSLDGVGFITRHRDPPAAGAVIAITTLAGRARFRIWDDDEGSDATSARHNREDTHEWDTEDGDLVVLRGDGWPAPTARCPVHEAESPAAGDRMALTLRYNKGGYGASYFNSATV